MPRPVVSVPFSITILTLMMLIVMPLASALLWLGWKSVDVLEQRSVDQRMTTLDDAVANFLADGLHTTVAVGLVLAGTPGFAAGAGPAADDQRQRQLAALLRRQPALAAAFVGYADASFIYAGRASALPAAQREEYRQPSAGEARPGEIVVRIVRGEGEARQERSWIVTAQGDTSTVVTRHADFDPRERPWYAGARYRGSPFLTDSYRFAWSGEPGISVGVPVPGDGVLGFDFALGKLSELVGEYKITPNAIVAIALPDSDIHIETRPCAPADGCLPTDGVARAALHEAIAEAVPGGPRLTRSVVAGGETYRLIVHPMPPLHGRSFHVAAAVPDSELSAASRALLWQAMEAAAAVVAIAVLAVLAGSLLLSRPLGRIAAKTERIRNLDFSDSIVVNSRITEILRLSQAVEQMREGLEVFGHYVSKGLVRQIMRSPESAGVGGVRRDLTVMFTDIEGFSRISESIEPELLTSRLSRYFEALAQPIAANRGMIDKYIGDSVMAFWNAPEPDPDHVANACRAALQAAAAGRQLAAKWRALGRPGFRTRFGLHSGPAVVGNVGARERINYTLVGAVANQASRLEGLNKIYGTDILASGEVARAAEAAFVWRPIDRIVTAGTTEVLDIHEPLAESAAAAEHAELLARWAAARAAYVEGRFADAIVLFAEVLDVRPGDGPSLAFIDRCRDLQRLGPPDGWDGAWRFEHK